MFPYLEAYLKLPAAERTRFRMAYLFTREGQPLTAAVWLLEGATRTPLPLRADGRVERLPTLAQLDAAKVQIDVPEGTKLGVILSIAPAMAPAVELDARELAASVAQAAVGARKAAGIMAMAMPRLQEVSFLGVASGEVEFGDGRRAALPLVKGAPTFNPATLPGAKTLRFPKPPSRLDIG
ncbi:hypothetical protein [Phenylobacterium sp.]|uniref:hypothetical protein n=1 Tax=Phenylobacterium sp. TaxID=1871053 RepID=UPI0025F7643C|nr:hypothetical protein [Phenylobacterium sp.]